MNATTESHLPLLGRCQDCDHALFATEDQVVEVESIQDVKQANVVYRVPNQSYPGATYLARCPARHRAFALHRIKGTFSEVHNCDARCLNAKGHDCTCSCGGANHGRGYAATAVVASEVQARFLGEVGKHIRGTAKVLAQRTLTNSVLYTFQTADGSATIKWFVPPAQDPAFEVGQEVTFRAKVKRHEDNEYGKATIVTYLEEIK